MTSSFYNAKLGNKFMCDRSFLCKIEENDSGPVDTSSRTYAAELILICKC
jgi:hypothetical protein